VAAEASGAHWGGGLAAARGKRRHARTQQHNGKSARRASLSRAARHMCQLVNNLPDCFRSVASISKLFFRSPASCCSICSCRCSSSGRAGQFAPSPICSHSSPPPRTSGAPRWQWPGPSSITSINGSSHKAPLVARDWLPARQLDDGPTLISGELAAWTRCGWRGGACCCPFALGPLSWRFTVALNYALLLSWPPLLTLAGAQMNHLVSQTLASNSAAAGKGDQRGGRLGKEAAHSARFFPPPQTAPARWPPTNMHSSSPSNTHTQVNNGHSPAGPSPKRARSFLSSCRSCAGALVGCFPDASLPPPPPLGVLRA